MNILIIGSGGREHALAWKIAQSPRASKIYVAPGNGGTREIAENVPIPAGDIKGLLAFAREKKIDLVVVGPDDSLALGIVDEFRAAGFPIFGPTQAAAQIEASKAFSKSFMKAHGIPTAAFEIFKDFKTAAEYLSSHDTKFPVVVKASGLALGKGVIIAKTHDEAESALRQIMIDRAFGTAGDEVVIEEFLEGREISIHAISDGTSFLMFPPAQDHKAAFDGDKGPNTGGMGTIAPLPWLVDAQDSKNPEIYNMIMRKIEDTIVKPTLGGMRSDGKPFGGLLYPGLMMTKDGPRVLEFNARFGDPETQSYMRLMKGDILEIFERSVAGTLGEYIGKAEQNGNSGGSMEWYSGYAACIVLASGGYPGSYQKGKKITGLEEVKVMDGVVVFHAGTTYENGSYYTAGGRVLGVTARGETLSVALALAYEAVKKIHFDGMQYRTDIGAKAL